MSVLRPETLAVLAAVGRERAPLFPNQILAELFEARNTVGPYKVLPKSVGGFVVVDTRSPLGAGAVSEHPTEESARAALERLARP